MLTQAPRPTEFSDRSLRRRVAMWTTLGVAGLAYAALLLGPKVAALVAGNRDVIGTGFVANLALVFGSLMFLREALRARKQLHTRPNEEL